MEDTHCGGDGDIPVLLYGVFNVQLPSPKCLYINISQLLHFHEKVPIARADDAGELAVSGSLNHS